jgi:hypothetical protein
MRALSASLLLHRQLSLVGASLLHSPLKLFHTSFAWSSETPAERAFRDRIQYPATPTDSDAFEDIESADYLLELPSKGEKTLPRYPCSVLRDLVSQQRYREAVAVFKELREWNVDIRPSTKYALMARHMVSHAVAQSPDESEPAVDPVTVLEDWLSLIPNRLPGPIVPNARGVRPDKQVVGILQVLNIGHFLMRHSRVPTAAVVRFSLIAARKGYGRDAHAHVIPYLARTLAPAELIQFLEDFADAMTHSSPPQQADTLGRMRQNMWSVAIRGAWTAGRLKDAHMLMHRAWAMGIRPTSFTFDVIHKAFLHHGLQQEAVDVQKWFGPKPLPPHTGASAAVPPQDSTLNGLSLSLRYPIDLNLAIARYSLHHGQNGDDIARANTLVPFFSICAEQAPNTEDVIYQLYSHAWALGARPLATLIHAHMLHYKRTDEHKMVLRTFARWFHPAGVPLDLLYKRIGHDLGRTWQVVTPLKLFPTPQVTALVWGAFARGARDPAQFRAAQAALLARAACAPRPAGARTSVDGAVLAEHFHQFIFPPKLPRGYVARDLAAHAREVLAQMRGLGIAPVWRTYTQVAAAHVLKRRPAPALGYLENALVLCREGTERARAEGRSAVEAVWVRDARRACAILIKALADRARLDGNPDMLDHARVVADRLVGEFKYVAGMDAWVDERLRLLKDVAATKDTWARGARAAVADEQAYEAGSVVAARGRFGEGQAEQRGANQRLDLASRRGGVQHFGLKPSPVRVPLGLRGASAHFFFRFQVYHTISRSSSTESTDLY